jgi:hypothetical protein
MEHFWNIFCCICSHKNTTENVPKFFLQLYIKNYGNKIIKSICSLRALRSKSYFRVFFQKYFGESDFGHTFIVHFSNVKNTFEKK